MEWLGLVVLGISIALLFLGWHLEKRIFNPKKRKKVSVTVKDGRGTYTIEGYSPEETVRLSQRLDEILKEWK